MSREGGDICSGERLQAAAIRRSAQAYLIDNMHGSRCRKRTFHTRPQVRLVSAAAIAITIGAAIVMQIVPSPRQAEKRCASAIVREAT